MKGFSFFCFPSFIFLIQNTRNTPSFTVVGFWGQRGGVPVRVIILAVTDGLNPTARKVRRSRRDTPKQKGVAYVTRRQIAGDWMEAVLIGVVHGLPPVS